MTDSTSRTPAFGTAPVWKPARPRLNPVRLVVAWVVSALGVLVAALILPGILVLALIVAFGSLTFTIAAIVAAPQVAAFLGLTFYSAGLDLARTPGGAQRPARWVTLPMGIAIAFLAFVTVIGVPAIASVSLR